MRLLYDARLAHRGLGIATFVTQLATELATDPDVELVWFGDPALAPFGTSSVVHAPRTPYPLLDGPTGRALARKLGVELVHFTGNTGWASRGPAPSVLTVHDLIFLDSGVRSHSPRQVIGHRYERWTLPQALNAADVLVVPSQKVADELQARIPQRRRPSVVYLGVEQYGDGMPVSRHATAPRQVSASPYVVAFAGRDPRKLTREVVAAWRRVSGAPLGLRLLVAGGMPPGLGDSLADEIGAGTVEIHDRLSRAEVLALLAGALALIYPSRDEGFGLPVLEGMAAGIPVLSGIAAVTREVGGDAIVQLDPVDVVGSVEAALRQLLSDPAKVQQLSARGLTRVREFTWRQTATGYLRAYREAVQGRQ